jgi:Reverse transcriptase (RNA-dependent DNA polymerase)
MKNYILNNNFRADLVSKMRIPSFVPEDTGLNWFESLTIYCAGVGIYVPPYATLEQGKPLGNLWPLIVKHIPYASDMETSWSNALFTLLSEAINDSPCRINCAKPSLSDLKGILMRNNGKGYKVLYDIMQYFATQLNLGTSTRIRNDGPPQFGKCKSVDEYLGQYKEYWVQRYFYSVNRTTCAAPELQLSFLDRLPKDIRIAFNLSYWRPDYDFAPMTFWYWDEIPVALRFDRIAEFVNAACERQDVALDVAISKMRVPRGSVHATLADSSDHGIEQFGSDDDDLDHGQVSSTTNSSLPLGTCPYCPDYAGRHHLKDCHSLARLYAGSKRLQSDAELRSHLEALYPGNLKKLPPRPKPTRTSPDSSHARSRGAPSRAPSKTKLPPRAKKVHATVGADDASSQGSVHELAEFEASPGDGHGTTSMAAVGGDYNELSYDEAFGCFMDLDDMDRGTIRALSNSHFPRFAVEDQDDASETAEFPEFTTEHQSIGDLDYLLHPFDDPLEDVHSFHGAVSMTRHVSICSTRGNSVAPWGVEARRHLFAHIDHGANLSVVYDWRILHRFAAKDGIVIHDVGGNQHPTLGHGFICLQAESHRQPVYIPAFYCPTLASNIISPQQFTHFLRGRRSATVCDHETKTGTMVVHSPADTHDVVIHGLLYDNLLWAGPLLPPPTQDADSRPIRQPWRTVRVPSRSPRSAMPGVGEAEDMKIMRMTQTRAAHARAAVRPGLIPRPPSKCPTTSPAPATAQCPTTSPATAPKTITRAEYLRTMARIKDMLSGDDPADVPPSDAAPLAPAVATVAPPSAPLIVPVPPPAPAASLAASSTSLPSPPPAPATSSAVSSADLPSRTPGLLPTLPLARRHYLLALLHQRLGHLHHRRLRDLHRFADGVPSSLYGIDEACTCGICLASKMRRTPSTNKPTRLASSPFEGLSVDLGFVVQRPDRSKTPTIDSGPPDSQYALSPLTCDSFDRLSASEKYRYQLGAGGEMGYVLVQDHFTGALYGCTLTAKTPPVDYLKTLLERMPCSSHHKYVRLDHGGDLGGSRRILDLFSKYGYSVQLTAPDTPHQNGLVERVNQDVGTYLRVALGGAGLSPLYWPYAFRHFIRLYNALPHRRLDTDGKSSLSKSPYEALTGQRPDLSALRTFGCRVWVRPPGGRDRKVITNARKGRFLGYARSMNICIYLDEKTLEVKETSNLRFDETHSDDLSPPPNATALRAISNGQPVNDPTDSPSDGPPNPSALLIALSPSIAPVEIVIQVDKANPCGGLHFSHDRDRDRAYITRIDPGINAKYRRLTGAFVLRVNGSAVQHVEEVKTAFRDVHASSLSNVKLVLDPEPFDISSRRENAMIRLSSEQLASIHSVRTAALGSTDFDGDTSAFRQFYDRMCAPFVLNALSAVSQGTDAERGLSRLTRARLKRLPTWHLWQRGDKGEFAQLDAMAKQGMYGPATSLPAGGILLRQHWTYIFKADGTRKARNCCDGSARAAPVLHGEAKTYASCIDQPCMRMFFALCATMDMIVYGADAANAFANSPPPSRPTFVNIDDAYWEWYKERHGIELDRSLVLPVLHALQGHPESGHLWEQLIDGILLELGLKSTTHERNLYRGTVSDVPVLVCRQVDDLAIGSSTESAYDAVIKFIGSHVELVKQGILTCFNGVVLHQTREYIMISCCTYIKQTLEIHGWSKPGVGEDSTKPIEPLPDYLLKEMQSETGPPEGSPEHAQLESDMKFNYRNVVGELVWVFIVCRIDVGFSVAFMTRFLSAPAAVHYRACVRLGRYLRITQDWGLIFWRPRPLDSLPSGNALLYRDPQLAETSRFPPLSDAGTLVAFADAAHATDLKKRRSVSGFATMLAGAAISYKSKLQPAPATSSTEAEFVCAVQAAKSIKYLRTVLHELGFPQQQPTVIYEDNKAAIAMINASKPTPRTRHIDTQYYAIQNWQKRGIVRMEHIAGTLCRADALTKPLSRILHHRHSRRLMGHYGPPAYATYTYDPAAALIPAAS